MTKKPADPRTALHKNINKKKPEQGFPWSTGLLISTESNLSTSPHLCLRRTDLAVFCFFSFFAWGQCCEEEESLQPSKHQEWNHCTVVTLHQIPWTNVFMLFVFCSLFPVMSARLSSQLPGCKYQLGAHGDGLKSLNKQWSFSLGVNTETHHYCTSDFSLDLISNYCPLAFFVLPGSLSTHPAILN